MLFRLLADAQYLDARLSKLDGSGDLGSYLVNMVDAKSVVAPAKPAAEKPSIERTQQEQKPAGEPSASDGANMDTV